jgi:UDP-GlcNAc:undecaprenyl-phosphate/decaprenyl-phosphate GlcNAc-1-phosphate transferase
MIYLEQLVPPILAFVLSLLLLKLIISLCHRYQIFDFPQKHKRHKKPTPNLGGVALFISIWTAVAVGFLLSPSLFSEYQHNIFSIFLGSLVIFLIGLVDDFKPVSAWIKLFTQIIAGLILYYGGLTIDQLTVPVRGVLALDGFAMIITVLWVVALTNAINLIDGLDGLAAGVSIIATATMIFIGILYSIEFVILFSASLLGALAAFWIFNRYPAKIFMGDNGSLLIGYFFAVSSLVVPIKSYTSVALFIPLIILGVPLTEAVSSVLRRLAAGKNVMRADRRHIFHYLSYAGLSAKKITYLFYLSSLFFSLISVGMFLFSRVTVLTILILFIVVILILYFIFISRIRSRQSLR